MQTSHSENDTWIAKILGDKYPNYQSAIKIAKGHAHTFSKNTSAMFGLMLVLIFLFVCAFGEYIAPYPDHATGFFDLDNKAQPPSWKHLFGTDEMGADVLSRVLVGARTSLYVGLTVTGIAIIIGVPLGIIAAYHGGWIEETIMRITDVFLSIPALVLAIAIVGALGPGIINAMFALSLVWWPGYVRLIYAKALTVRQELFVESTRSLGAGDSRIIFIHILPNCISTVIVKGSMDMGQAILAAAGLGFIGLGAQPPLPEWGAMLSVARTYLPDWWWYALFPGLAIYFTVLGFGLLGDGLRDILDPKQKD